MSVKLYGHIQYATSAEGDAAKAWMDGWAAAHDALVYTHPGLTNGHTLSVIDPPNPNGGCVSQFDYEYHFDLPQAEIDFIQGEIELAVQVTVAAAACDSEAGSASDF